MNAHNLTSTDFNLTISALFKSFFAKIASLSEAFWFCLAFLLFIAVVMGLWSLANSEECKDAAEPAYESL